MADEDKKTTAIQSQKVTHKEKSEDSREQWGPLSAIIVGVMAFLLPQFFVAFLVGAFYAGIGREPTEFSDLINTNAWARLGLELVLAILRISLIYLYIRKIGGFAALGLKKVKLRKYGYVFPAFGFYFIFAVALATLTAQLFPSIDPNQAQDVGYKATYEGLDLVLAFIGLVIIAPVAEEILFRGYIFKGLLKKFQWPVAAFFTSVLFGLAHFQFNVSINTFALSMALCWLVIETKSLYPAIMLHSIKNAIAFATVFIFKV